MSDHALTTASYVYAGDPDYIINFPLGFIDREHIQVRVNAAVDGLNDPVYTTFDWVDDSNITLTGTLVNGDLIVISRTVPKEDLVVNFRDGADVTPENLHRQALHLLMVYHELLDGRVEGVESPTISAAASEASSVAAALSAVAAAASELASASSASASASSASAASTSASAAASSSSTAETAETTTLAAAAEALADRLLAAISASTATTQAGTATTQASAAASSASTASSQATAAATSEGNADSSATAAASSASAAATSASAASGSAAAASTSATASASSATASDTSAVNAGTSASNASTSATQAGTSASNASTSASSSGTSAANAATSASTASTQAGNASTSATDAQNAATAAAVALDDFEDIYLGAKSSDPSLDNDGDALAAGALYFNTTDNAMRNYTGSSWVTVYIAADGLLELTGGTMAGQINMAGHAIVGLPAPGLGNSAATKDYVDAEVMTGTERTKLNGIETNATKDQTNAQIKTALLANNDTNVMTDVQQTKLNALNSGIATIAEAEAGLDNVKRMPASRVAAAIAAQSGGGWDLIGSTELLSDSNAVTFTGLAGYNRVTLTFILQCSVATGQKYIEVRETGGAWRTVARFNNPAGSNDVLIGHCQVFNLDGSEAANLVYSLISVGSPDLTQLDRSNVDEGSVSSLGGVGYTSFAETVDEIRVRATSGIFEGSSSDQRGTVTVRAQ